MNKSEKQEQWAAERVQYIRGLKSPNEQQKLMLILTDKADKTAHGWEKWFFYGFYPVHLLLLWMIQFAKV